MKFSDVVKFESPKIIKMNFSIGASPVSVKNLPKMKNFSEDPNSQLIDYQLQCFSLLERIRLSKRTPRQILRLRVNEVVRFLRMSSADKIKENKYTIVQYLNEYVYEIIVKLMNEPGLKLINLRLQLGLPSLIKNLSSVRNLERFLLQAKREYKTKGYLTKRIQDLLTKYYTEFMNDLLISIEDRYLKNSGKEGILSGNDELVEQNPLKLAAFAETSDSDVLTSIYEIIDSDSDNCDSLIKKLDSMSPNQKFIDPIMDDPELTKLLNAYIENKDESSKASIVSYLTNTVQFSEKMLVPNFSLTMSEVEELSRDGSVPDTETVEDESVKESENLDTLEDILPPAEEVYLDSPAYRVGTMSNFGRKLGYVALRSGSDYLVKLYQLPKNSKIKNFSEWSKVPYKSIKVSTMDELNKYI